MQRIIAYAPSALFFALAATFGVGCAQDHSPTGSSSYSVIRCAPDGSCDDGAVCTEGLCLLGCAADSDCPGDAICLEGECYTERGDACAASSDCDPAEHCAAGVCGGLPPTRSCVEDSECPAGARCVDGDCVADPTGCDPAGAEVCRDGVDNDCDGAVDEGCDPTDCTADADCGPREVCCAGVCADPLTDSSNCGACGLACAAGESCSSGVCGTCDPARGGEFCGCDPTTAGPEVCGDAVDNDCDGFVDEGCSIACGGGIACGAGLVCCGESCVDVASDPSHCGMCGAVCADGTTCVDGACTVGGGVVCRADSDCAPSERCEAGLCVGGCDPTTPERCDGVDNDCDGVVDEGCA